MQRYHRKHTVPFTASQMFDLVLEIESYPEFLPFCESLEVLAREQMGEGEKITANMEVGYKQFSENYTSLILTYPESKRIEVSCIDGPLKALENNWAFRELADEGACEIDLGLSYKFRNPLMQAAMTLLLDRAFDKFLRAFEARAREKYT